MHTYHAIDPPWQPPAVTVLIFVAILVACVVSLSWLLWSAGLFIGDSKQNQCAGENSGWGREGAHDIEGTIWIKKCPSDRGDVHPNHEKEVQTVAHQQVFPRQDSQLARRLDMSSTGLGAVGDTGFRPCWHVGRPLDIQEAGRVMMETMSVSGFLSGGKPAAQRAW